MHGQDAAGNELSVLPDVKVPRLDPHQVIETKLQYQTPLCANLDKDYEISVTVQTNQHSLTRHDFDYKLKHWKAFVSGLEFVQGFCNIELLCSQCLIKSEHPWTM